MAGDEKPYRLYRGGRARGRVPLQRYEKDLREDDAPSPPGQEPRVRKRHVIRWVGGFLLLAVLLFVVWAVTSFFAFRSGISQANERVPKSVLGLLTNRDGMLTSTPTTILVLGTDGSSTGGRSDANRSDSIMLLHTDPGRDRIAYLSIPRDLRVEIPGLGTAKINAASQFGGPTLALRAVKTLTGLDINHVAFVDFDRFSELIDAVGGIDVTVAAPIRSNRFDCPYDAKGCAGWEGWRFEKGRQHMDGRRALVYSRIRKNALDAGETDFTRARRQQQVIEATLDKLTSIGTAVRFPFIGDEVTRPLATDLTTGETIQLGWAAFRADAKRTLHCRLGGEPATVGGESVILGSEDNVAVVSMFTGRSAPLAPARGLPYAPGCLVGRRGE
jgi:LCP family protein required for cell wall assembly